MSDKEVRQWAIKAQEYINSLQDKLYSAEYILEECGVCGLSDLTGLPAGVIAEAFKVIFPVDKLQK